MVAAAFLALACSNPFSPGLAGSMNLNLPRALGGYRTMASWSIQGSGPQGATHNQAIALGETQVVIEGLAVGAWTFRISALDGAGAFLAWGEGSTVIAAGQNNLHIVMQAANSFQIVFGVLEPELSLDWVNVSNIITFTATAGFLSYTWFFDGVLYTPFEGEVPAGQPYALAVSLDAIYSSNVRRVTVVVEDEDGNYWSTDTYDASGSGWGGGV
ncbi:MAG: hypothetical protein A2087_02180 [Spirochaetes bacterium GWD1_61_31]|nr:MAG: hypothetical protein A2Y37_11915 [Spirochaetes bacterium GWB1_60_80]OHD33893.1 MAG: hypothetical protein A2004_01285 [Spirochaetes bacterium GWC1_61_12]OHD43830.1 MAG: hypothetical protein A2087_02180 [Spirochaetes bacterium GWD1_61_31]OHD46073.1 MAG: hypothetical protein A2Y35_13740 [Spirochaetes bacterium GWE1_60_18]OHD60645.1 MAG: hypothetical protein A2Y32_08230 [Spirochaetes bacterium GWF1_60_12]HAP44263.1 hypothetical protein [Spirochaetaceae bacterium]